MVNYRSPFYSCVLIVPGPLSRTIHVTPDEQELVSVRLT